MAKTILELYDEQKAGGWEEGKPASALVDAEKAKDKTKYSVGIDFSGTKDADDKAIVNELIGKENWRKIFLIHYLHSLLLSSANMDLPTNDNEHTELDIALKSVEKEQLKYIKDFWFSKQIDKTREFEQPKTRGNKTRKFYSTETRTTKTGKFEQPKTSRNKTGG